MEFYFMKNRKLNGALRAGIFRRSLEAACIFKPTKPKYFYKLECRTDLQILPVVNKVSMKGRCDSIRKKLLEGHKMTESASTDKMDFEGNCQAELSMCIDFMPSHDGKKQSVGVRVALPNNLSMRTIFGADVIATVKLTFASFPETMSCVSAKNMVLQDNGQNYLMAAGHNVNIPGECWNLWQEIDDRREKMTPVMCTLTIKLGEDSPALETDFRNPAVFNQNILEEEILSDFSILSGDNVEIRCHKVFLAVHSSRLRSLMESETMSNKRGRCRLEMKELSEKSVRALLAFLYSGDTEMARKNPAVAYDLLQSAINYDIPALQKYMENILFKKRST